MEMNVPPSKLAMWIGILMVTGGFYIGFTSPDGTLSLIAIVSGLGALGFGANMMAKEEEERSQQSMKRFMAMIENSDEVKQAKEEQAKKSGKKTGKKTRESKKLEQQEERPIRRRVLEEEEEERPTRRRVAVAEEEQSERPARRRVSVEREELERPARRPVSVEREELERPARRPVSVEREELERPTRRPASVDREEQERPTRRRVVVEKEESTLVEATPVRSRARVVKEEVGENFDRYEEDLENREEVPQPRRRVAQSVAEESEGRTRRTTVANEKKKRKSKGKKHQLEEEEVHDEEEGEEDMIKFPLGKKPEPEPPELRPSRNRVQADNYQEEDGQPRSRFRPRGGVEETARKYVPRERAEEEEEEEFAPVRTRPRRGEEAGEMYREKVDYEAPLVQVPQDMEEESSAMRFRRRAEEGAMAPPRSPRATVAEEIVEEYSEEERLQAMKMGVNLDEEEPEEEEWMEALTYTEEEREQAEKMGIDLEAQRLEAEEKMALRQEEREKQRRQAILERQEVEIYDGSGIQKKTVASTRAAEVEARRQASAVEDDQGYQGRRVAKEEFAEQLEVYEEEPYEEEVYEEEIYEEEAYEDEAYEEEPNYSQEELHQAMKMGITMEELDATMEEEMTDRIHTDVVEYLPEEVTFALQAPVDMEALNAQFEQELREEYPERYAEPEEEIWEEELATGVHVDDIYEEEDMQSYSKEERLQAMKMGVDLHELEELEEEEDWDEEAPIPLTPEEMLQAAKMGMSFAELDARHQEEQDYGQEEYEEEDFDPYEEGEVAVSSYDEEEEEWEEKRPVRRADAQEESWKEQQKLLASQLAAGLPGSATRKPIVREEKEDHEIALRGKPKLMIDEEPAPKKGRKMPSKLSKHSSKEDLSQMAGRVMPTEDDYDYAATPKVSFQSKRREEGSVPTEDTGKSSFRSRRSADEGGSEGLSGLLKKKR